GGSASQCTGRADAPYPGSGTGQACAWRSPETALANIAGGDTVIIGAGSYAIGANGLTPAVPSGTSSGRTRILGKAGTRPKLVGTNATHRVINLQGSSHVEIGNLEITDGSDCVFNHSDAGVACGSGDAYARAGIYASASRDVWLHDLDIHGLGSRGIQAGGLADWTVERTRINRNGAVGWNGDIGSGSANTGKIVLREVEIGWNGCGERVDTGAAWACWGQKAGGYGDGLGTAASGGQWVIEDAFVHHNTSDGLDFYHLDGGDNTSVVMRRVHAVANAGNQVKITGTALVENSVLVGHCTYFRNRHFMQDGDLCRAYGATLRLVLTGNDTVVVRHNT
ncbi:hypothetical protein, partial [Luteimonas pelagia]